MVPAVNSKAGSISMKSPESEVMLKEILPLSILLSTEKMAKVDLVSLGLTATILCALNSTEIKFGFSLPLLVAFLQ